MKRLAIINTHPIQYNAPLYKLLAKRNKIEVKIFYTWSQSSESVQDAGFGREIQWDIPLLDGYEHEFITNTSKNPSNKHFFGIKNPDLIRQVSAYRPDAILVYGWNFESHYRAMRYFKGKVPVWFRGDSHLLDERPGLRQLLRRNVLRGVYRTVDKAFYVGSHNKSYFLAHGLREHQLVYAPHAVDVDFFHDTDERAYQQKAHLWRTALGYSKDDIVILFAGKFESKKNPTLLIELFNKYIKRESNLKLLMVGNGILEGELRQVARGNENIQFLPFQNQSRMPVLYRVGDVFCLPSKGPGETWGLAVNEALASGRPVLVSQKVGCAIDLVKMAEIGWSFCSENGLDELSDIVLNIDIEQIRKDDFVKVRQEFIKGWSHHSVCRAFETSLI